MTDFTDDPHSAIARAESLLSPEELARIRAAELASAIVEAIREDFTDRRGLRHEWDQIDEAIREEIIAAWTAIALEKIEASR